jgi:hypothetical protein
VIPRASADHIDLVRVQRNRPVPSCRPVRTCQSLQLILLSTESGSSLRNVILRVMMLRLVTILRCIH